MTDARDDLLDDAAIKAALPELPGWDWPIETPESLRARFAAPTFLAGIALVDDVAAEAERADHHPDIDIRWRTVTFALSTHSKGGITGKDVALAKVIGALAERHGATAERAAGG